MLVVYGGLIGLAVYQFQRAPTGFIPEQDQGYLITAIQLPPGSSMERTDKVVREATKLALSVEGTAHTAGFAGLDGATLTSAPNCRRHLRHPEAVRGAGRRRHHQGPDPQRTCARRWARCRRRSSW